MNMKKRILALLLGLAMAVGGLSVMTESMVVHADNVCKDTAKHFSYCTATAGDGKIMVEWISDIATTEQGYGREYNDVTFYVSDTEVKDCQDKFPSNFSGESADDPFEWTDLEKVYPMKAGNYTFTGLTNDTTYYIYVSIDAKVDENGNSISSNDGGKEYPEHNFKCVGSCTPAVGLSDPQPVKTAGNTAAKPSSTASSPAVNVPSSNRMKETHDVSYIDQMDEQIANAEPGSTVVLDEGISALSNSTMQELLKKGDVDLRMEFTYDGVDYIIVIPAGAALDNDIPWYGHLYLTAHFGNQAANTASSAGSGTDGSYTVQPGDSMSKIAQSIGMTLSQLAAKNPQIQDMDKIKVGQKINW